MGILLQTSCCAAMFEKVALSSATRMRGSEPFAGSENGKQQQSPWQPIPFLGLDTPWRTSNPAVRQRPQWCAQPATSLAWMSNSAIRSCSKATPGGDQWWPDARAQQLADDSALVMSNRLLVPGASWYPRMSSTFSVCILHSLLYTPRCALE